MKSRISITLLLFLPIVMQAQIRRDARDFLSDFELEQVIEQPSVDFRQHKYSNEIFQLSKPSLSPLEQYKPMFITPKLKFEDPYKAFNPIQYSSWKPNAKLSIEGKNIGYKNNYFSPENLTGLDLKASYKLTDKLSVNAYGYYIANNYKNPTVMQSTLFRPEIGTNLSYNITKNLKVKAGMQYVYNPITRRWEYMFCTGIALDF